MIFFPVRADENNGAPTSRSSGLTEDLEQGQRASSPQLTAWVSERISSHPERPFPVDRRMAILAKGRLCRPVDRRMAIFAKGRLSASGRSAVPIFWRDSLPGVGQDAFS